MLVITRSKGKSFMIGDDIEIVLIRATGGQARIGIKAPDDVRVARKEVYEKGVAPLQNIKDETNKEV